MEQRWVQQRIGPVSAMGGVVLLVVGTFLHPLGADPMDAVAAFTEYAADQLWVASHLTQWLGVVLLVGALVVLSEKMAHGPAATWARLGAAGAIACLAATSALQAVDGIALKVMVDAWASAPDRDQTVLFPAALAVRHIEIGLASITTMLFGLTLSMYGIAGMADHSWPAWFAWLGIVSGGLAVVAGVVTAHTGFSAAAMAISMPASALLLAWIVGVAFFMWPRGKEV